MIRGVTAGRPPLDDMLVVDIGGGSTELVRRERRGRRVLDEPRRRLRANHRALPLVGSAVATRAGRRGRVRALAPAGPRGGRAIGVAGTVTTLATLDLGDAEYDPERTHGHRLPLASVERAARAARGDDAPRSAARSPGSSRVARPVIVAGVVVLREVMTAYGLAEIEVSEHDVLARRRVRSRGAARARGGRGATRRLHVLLDRAGIAGAAAARLRGCRVRRPAAAARPLRPRRAAAGARCARALRRGDARRPRRGRAPRPRLRGSGTRPRAGTSGPIVKCGASAIARSSVVVGSRPGATTSRTSVLRVTTPTSRSSSVT